MLGKHSSTGFVRSVQSILIQIINLKRTNVFQLKKQMGVISRFELVFTNNFVSGILCFKNGLRNQVMLLTRKLYEGFAENCSQCGRLVITFCLISGQPHRHAKIGQSPHHGCFDFLGVWAPEQRINECPHRLLLVSD